MKRKLKKLDLHVETLRKLNTENLEQVAGGISIFCNSDVTAPCTECTKACSVCIGC